MAASRRKTRKIEEVNPIISIDLKSNEYDSIEVQKVPVDVTEEGEVVMGYKMACHHAEGAHAYYLHPDEKEALMSAFEDSE